MTVCRVCLDTGTLLARWVIVNRHHKLEERCRVVYCDCAAADELAAQHAKMSAPPQFERGYAFATNIQQSPVGAIDGSIRGLLWWTVEDRARPWAEMAMPASLRAALNAQAGAVSPPKLAVPASPPPIERPWQDRAADWEGGADDRL